MTAQSDVINHDPEQTLEEWETEFLRQKAEEAKTPEQRQADNKAQCQDWADMDSNKLFEGLGENSHITKVLILLVDTYIVTPYRYLMRCKRILNNPNCIVMLRKEGSK